MSAPTGRMTHDHDGPLGVFLIGMRLNRWWRVDQWFPVFLAMPRMLTELYRNRAAADRGEEADLGFLGARTLMGGRGVTVVQYWRSTEDIYRYAASTEHAHRAAWSAFNARARKAAGAVGIWHETYAVPAGGHESVYVVCPPMGLALATSRVPARLGSARAGLAVRARSDGSGASSGHDDVIADGDLVEEPGDATQVTDVDAPVGRPGIPAGREVR